MLRVALDNEVRRYKMSARKLTVLTVVYILFDEAGAIGSSQGL
ncbi:MAG: hypothetical protein OD814_000539 [Candidatus Alkanophagales archaeon MCA70_species_1]|nr:hypothetical protein [Candidatus Alkanophaga volatiphilum]